MDFGHIAETVITTAFIAGSTIATIRTSLKNLKDNFDEHKANDREDFKAINSRLDSLLEHKQ